MSEMIDISKLKTWDKPHKVYIPSKYGVFVKKEDLEKLLETAHNSEYKTALNVYKEFDEYDETCELLFSDWLHARLNQQS